MVYYVWRRWMCLKVDELIKLKNALFEESNKLTILKGRGYGSEEDTFLNLKLIEFVGVVDAITGTYIRLSDKIVRLGRIIKMGEQYVGFEGFIDTVVDAINYLTYLPALKYERDDSFREKFDNRFFQRSGEV
jgi:hypothetical protein